MYYSYHGRIMERIKNGELIGYRFDDDWPKIGRALVLIFSTFPFTRPIRVTKWAKYVGILDELFPDGCNYEKK